MNISIILRLSSAVNSLVEQALKMKASDIHIEPLMDKVRVRFRIDGDLHETLEIPIKSHLPL